jgi:hypothetical protein
MELHNIIIQNLCHVAADIWQFFKPFFQVNYY